MIQAQQSPASAEARESVSCAFCKGKGTDPFNQLSSLSVCSACDGQGTLSVPVPHVRCAYCEGTGSHKTYRCPVCGGAGATAALTAPTKNCPSCEGLAFEASSGLVCLTCRGHGVVPV